MFGISKPMKSYPLNSSAQITGDDFSYLVASGPGDRIYWFLFSKLEKKTQGLYEKIPRFTQKDEEDLVQKRGSDRITGDITFRDIYNGRNAANLTALPEFVFKKWHFGRIITIGDSAHKVRMAPELSQSRTSPSTNDP